MAFAKQREPCGASTGLSFPSLSLPSLPLLGSGHALCPRHDSSAPIKTVGRVQNVTQRSYQNPMLSTPFPHYARDMRRARDMALKQTRCTEQINTRGAGTNRAADRTYRDAPPLHTRQKRNHVQLTVRDPFSFCIEPPTASLIRSAQLASPNMSPPQRGTCPELREGFVSLCSLLRLGTNTRWAQQTTRPFLQVSKPLSRSAGDMAGQSIPRRPRGILRPLTTSSKRNSIA